MRIFLVMVLILVAGAVPGHGRTESEGTVFNKTQPLESMNNVTESSRMVVPYSDLYLVMQWPKSFCNLPRFSGNGQCYPPNPDRFTVHGLWPQSSQGGINCSDTHTYGRYPLFELPQLNGLNFRVLNYYWPDLTRRDGWNDQFWGSEYNKHGSCTFNNQYRYFALTLRLVARLRVGNRDLISLLSNLPIGQRVYPGGRYYSTFIERAVSRVTSRAPILHCRRIGNILQLLEIRFCADPHTDQLISCNVRNVRSNCGNSLVLLP